MGHRRGRTRSPGQNGSTTGSPSRSAGRRRGGRARVPSRRGLDERGSDAAAALVGEDGRRADVGRPSGMYSGEPIGGPTDSTPRSTPRAGPGGRRGRRAPTARPARVHRGLRRFAQVRAEDRTAGMEHGLLVDEAVDDVQVVGFGDADLDVGWRRPAGRRQVATATLLTRPNPSATHAGSASGVGSAHGRRGR